jgi:coenzyme PQQ precursor peptide PqqA
MIAKKVNLQRVPERRRGRRRHIAAPSRHDKRRVQITDPALAANFACRTVPFRFIVLNTEAARSLGMPSGKWKRKRIMAWTTPVLVEICIGLEINGYLPAEL